MRLRSGIGLVAILLVAASASAQEGADTLTTEEQQAPVYRLEELRVTVTRAFTDITKSPFAVSSLSVDDLQRAELGLSMQEGLRYIPGVFAQNRQNFALGDRLTIRGVGARAQFGVRGIQIIQDGIPLTMPDGQAALTNLDLSAAGDVEVIRGPASALYGNAAGGVLSYETQDFWPQPLAATPHVVFGSDELQKIQLGASGELGAFGYRLNANRVETDGFRNHAHAEMYRANLVTEYALSEDTELGGVFNFFRMPFGENPSSLARTDALNNPEMVRDLIVSQGAGEEDTQGQGGVRIRHRFGPDHEIRGTVWGLWRDIWNPIPFTIIDLSRVAAGVRSEYQGSDQLGSLPLSWTAGLDLGLQHDEREEFANDGVPAGGDRTVEGEIQLDQRERVLSFGPFLQLDAQVLPRWRLTVAGRLDTYEFDVEDHLTADGDDSGDRTFTEFSPMAGITYTPVQAVNIYTNYATAFETPTTSELSNRPDGSGGFNQNLRPVDTESFELGVKGFIERPGLWYDVTGYVANVDGALIPFEGPTEEVFFRNAGEITRTGAEAQLVWFVASGLRANLAYTYQRSEFDEFVTEDADFSDNLEPGVPQHQLFLGTTYSTPFGLTGEANLRWVDAYPVNNANTAFNWSYRVVDLRLTLERSTSLGRVRPFLGIDNLFDERYNGSVVPNAFGDRFFEPAPGFTIYSGLEIRLSRR